MTRQPSFESIHLPHFATNDGVQPSRIVKLYSLYGDLARFGSIQNSGESHQTPIQCRKRPGRRQCRGLLIVRRRDLPAVIEWLCPDCEAAGEISGWQQTDADLRGLEWSANPDATTVPVSADAHRELRQLARDDAAWLPVLYGSGIHAGLPALSVTCDQARRFTDLAMGAAVMASSDRCRRLLISVALALTAPFEDQTPGEGFIEVDPTSGPAFLEMVMSADDATPPQFAPARPRPRPRSTRRTARRTAKTCQLKVTLRNVKPPVWRRLIVPSDISLNSLHDVVQAAMGWYDCHLHMFRVGQCEYAPPGDWDPVGEDSTGVVLCDLAPRKGNRLIYEYDFGDGWQHDILIEDVIDQKCAEVRCLTGRRHCPPEDCGGPWGYDELRAALSDPGHERHDELRGWAPVGFDAEEFDVAEVDESVRRVRV